MGTKRRSYKQIKDKEKLEYFKSIVPHNFTKDIIKLYYEKFGETLSKTDVENIKRTYGLYSNVRNLNKGVFPDHLKDYLKKRTRGFQEERITKRGYVEIKTNRGRTGWERKSHYIWEQHNGKIPKNHFIGFKDGNKLNCNIENLILLSYTDRIIFNFNHLAMNSGEDLLNTNILISKLMQKSNQIKQNKKGAIL